MVANHHLTSLRRLLPLLAAGLLLALPTRSQPVTFNTLAGYPGGGAADGTGNAAQFNQPGGVAVDTSGNIYVADTFNHTIRKISRTGIVQTIAGLAGVSGATDASGTDARFNQPGGLAVDSSGLIYVADSANHTVRKITPGGAVSTLAGSAGVSGSTDANGTNAQFSLPQGVAVDTAGNVYVADYGNHTIRMINPGADVSTLAGLAGTPGSTDATGNNARFYQPEGVAVDAVGNVYVADTANGTIRKISASGATTTLAGLAGTYGSADGVGTNAQFYQPQAVAVDRLGNVYAADYISHTIRKVTSAGAVITIAGAAGKFGSADGTNSTARFWGPEGVAADAGGQVFVADTGNGTIRRLTSDGPITTVTTLAASASAASADGTGNDARFSWPGALTVTVAGTVFVADTENSTIRQLMPSGLAATLAGSPGNFGSGDGAGASAQFFGPQGITADLAGNLYVADTANATIRKVTPGGGVTTIAGTAGSTGSFDSVNGPALFNQPQGVAMDPSGNIYVADTWNHTIRLINSAGVVTTIAGLAGNFGSADGTSSKARFYWPAGVAVDGSGNLFVSDYLNHTIRKLTPAGSTWLVTTIAGMPGIWGAADGPYNTARFNRPQGIALDGAGNLYVLDSGNETLRKLSPSGTNWIVSTVGGLAGVSGSDNGLGAAARFHSPAGLSIRNGSLYVADSANNTIRLGSLSANGAPAVINQPQSQNANPGSNVTFSVTVNGFAPLSYQWRFNGGDIASATDSAYTRVNAQTGDAGNYSVAISNAVGNVTSADASLVLNAAPFIVNQPQSQVVSLGQSASFNVQATGTAPLFYQWRFQGNDIPGANGSTFTIPSVQGPNQGAYSVAAINSVGVAVSADALLSFAAITSAGDNSFGQTTVPSPLAGVIAIAAGSWHSLALQANGGVVAWGNNFSGQCDVPSSLTDALAIAAGGYHNLAIRPDGTVLAWGANDYGQTNVPAGLTNVLAVAGGTWHSVALRADGTLVAWGDNSVAGQTNVPAGLNSAIAITAGGNHSLALKANGTVVAWGENTGAGGEFAGQSIVPPGLTNVTSIAAGEYHSLAVRADGTVVAWGDNAEGQCATPAGLSNVVAVAAGGGHSLALRADGTIAAWGADWNGQCDLSPGLNSAVGLAAGTAHSLILVGGSLPNPRLLNPTLRTNRFSALIQTLNRKHYALEYSTSLVTPQWNGIITNAGNGALEILADPAANAPQRLYRMRQW